jgi:Rrf2 family protein
MKASLKLEYSLRVLSQLARRHRGTAVTRIEELARLEDIPANYLVQLLNELREGGLVVSKRGKTGGYRLAKDAEDISLKQVLAVVEPELVETKITLKGASGPQVAALWREVSKRFDKSLTGFTVAQLALSESGTDFEICALRGNLAAGSGLLLCPCAPFFPSSAYCSPVFSARSSPRTVRRTSSSCWPTTSGGPTSAPSGASITRRRISIG